jgi:steroid 5-alpha reductase family enzyme
MMNHLAHSSPAHTFVGNLPWVALTVLGWVTLAFLASRVVKRHAVIDVFWGAGFAVVLLESLAYFHANATTTLFHHGLSSKLIASALVVIWALRLSIYLALRQRGQSEDPRYVAILRGRIGNDGLLQAYGKVYLLQGGLLFFVSLPLQWLATATHFNHFLLGVGVVLVAVGLFFEAVGDAQLRRFIANPSNAGKTMNQGLWAWTRHPNYFGDAVVWWGFFAVCLATSRGWLFVLSPLAMTYLLTRVSGKPMLERKLKKTREGYAEYVANTSAFFPRPPKKR